MLAALIALIRTIIVDMISGVVRYREISASIIKLGDMIHHPSVYPVIGGRTVAGDGLVHVHPRL